MIKFIKEIGGKMNILAFAGAIIGPIIISIAIIFYASHKIPSIWGIYFGSIICIFAIFAYWHNKVVQDKDVEINNKPLIVREIADPIEAKKEEKSIELSNTDIQKIVEGVAREIKKKPSSKDEVGSVVFGVFEKDIIIPNEQISCPIKVNWETAKIINNPNDTITIMLPSFHGDTKTSKGLMFESNTLTLEKVIGATSCPYHLNEIMVCIKIIDIIKDVVMISINILEIPY